MKKDISGESPLVAAEAGFHRTPTMYEDLDNKIEELTKRFRKLLEGKCPAKGSTFAEIEELTEQISQTIEAEIEDCALNDQGDGKQVINLLGIRHISRAYHSFRTCGHMALLLWTGSSVLTVALSLRSCARR